MAKNSLLLLLPLLVALCSLSASVHGYANQDQGGAGQMGPAEEQGSGESSSSSRFLLQESMQVVRTDAGEMRVARGGSGGGFGRSPLLLAWITMEPSSLFIPQYLDSNLLLFIRRGGARVGHIYKDAFVERTLEEGDVYTIESGSPFYIVNEAQGQRLHVIAGIDISESYGEQWNKQGFQSFFIGGGTSPPSILAGFDPSTMSTALNISMSELQEFLSSKRSGPIVHYSNTTSSPSLWSNFLGMNKREKLAHLKGALLLEEEMNDLLDEQPSWSFRRFLTTLLGRGAENKKSGDSGPEAYNIFSRKPDFSNDYGLTKAVSQKDYSPLRRTNTGIYLVNLTAGAMLAPHINPRATEYGVVLNGVGSIQVVFPNGTLAMNAEVREGDAFWIPRYFPFCQIASRSGTFVFFGFTTSARNNRPQFLVGANSLLTAMAGPELAAGLGIPEERLRRISGAQKYSAIFPAASVSPGGGQGE